MIIPFGCYLWGLRGLLPLPATWPRPVRFVLFLLFAAALTVCGMAYGLMIITQELASS